MRVSLIVLAALAGLAAAQNSTDTNTQILGDCVVQCTEQAMDANPESAKKCLDTDSEEAQAACICHEKGLLDALQSCIQKTCPDVSQDIDLLQSCKQTGASAPRMSVALFPILAASGAVAVGVLMV